MARPLVAIVGRPNVGKSMLFNRLAGRRLSIVEDTPGVTRDRLYADCEWNGRKFDIVDTGGIEPSTDNEILLFMREQAQIAMDAADVIVFVTEIATGVTAADRDHAFERLFQKGRHVVAGHYHAEERSGLFPFSETGHQRFAFRRAKTLAFVRFTHDMNELSARTRRTLPHR